MKLDRWIQAGQFSLDLPESWLVSETEDCTEIIPSAEDAAIHVSVYKRTLLEPPSFKDAISLIENFSDKNDLCQNANLKHRSSAHGYTCTGFFSGSGEASEPLFWVVKSIAGKKIAVLATLCSDNTEAQTYKEGLSILGSLTLEEI
ncbi:MAG: hypothetical protein ABL951_15485 [Alphaproteobacteria bacterium]